MKHYQNAGLIPWLEKIREPGRYQGMNGVNVLTNAAPDDDYDVDEVNRELSLAVNAGRLGLNEYSPRFSHPLQGFSRGLNPYTDWSLAQLEKPPTHYYLFMGLDWYSISDLGHTNRWQAYLENPFDPDLITLPNGRVRSVRDAYWLRLWRWILGESDSKGRFLVPSLNEDIQALQKRASAFIAADGGAFIFHNRIPYLRPAGFKSSSTKWYEVEWGKGGVSKPVREDLARLREIARGRILAYCTDQVSAAVLEDADVGYKGLVHCWGSHPSWHFFTSEKAKVFIPLRRA